MVRCQERLWTQEPMACWTRALSSFSKLPVWFKLRSHSWVTNLSPDLKQSTNKKKGGKRCIFDRHYSRYFRTSTRETANFLTPIFRIVTTPLATGISHSSQATQHRSPTESPTVKLYADSQMRLALLFLISHVNNFSFQHSRT